MEINQEINYINGRGNEKSNLQHPKVVTPNEEEEELSKP